MVLQQVTKGSNSSDTLVYSRHLGSPLGHFVPTFKTLIYGYFAFVDNQMCLETLNVLKI